MPRMHSNELTHEQAARIRAALAPSVRYLGKLKDRMDQVGFLPHDPLYELVKDAYNAVHHLSMDLHYRSCKSGVYRGREK